MKAVVTVIGCDRVGIIADVTRALADADVNIIDISQTTAFYFFSDGYIDQFGGEENTKFSTRRLKNLLHAIHAIPMEEQKAILGRVILDWQGTKEKQIDDIAVLGIRI